MIEKIRLEFPLLKVKVDKGLDSTILLIYAEDTPPYKADEENEFINIIWGSIIKESNKVGTSKATNSLPKLFLFDENQIKNIKTKNIGRYAMLEKDGLINKKLNTKYKNHL